MGEQVKTASVLEGLPRKGQWLFSMTRTECGLPSKSEFWRTVKQIRKRALLEGGQTFKKRVGKQAIL